MDILKEIEAYRSYVKKNTYVYSLQKQGLDLFYTFLKRMESSRTFSNIPSNIIDYFLAVWIPRNKKYLTEAEAFNIIYTMQDFQSYLEDKHTGDEELPVVLDLYRQDYVRLYKAKKLISEMVGDPIISTNPIVIHLDNYKEHKEKKERRDSMCVYEQGVFKIDEINKEGYIGLMKLNGTKYCKVLCRPNLLYHFKENDLLHVSLRKKIFFVYWEIDDIKVYYPSCATQYL